MVASAFADAPARSQERALLICDGRAPARGACRQTARREKLIVPVDFFAPFVALLRLDGQCGDGSSIQPLERDGPAGFLAETVGTVLDPAQRRVDLGDQLALAVAGAQFQLPFGLGGSAVRQIGMRYGFRL